MEFVWMSVESSCFHWLELFVMLVERSCRDVDRNVGQEFSYREFRQTGGFGGMLETDPTAARLVPMDSYGIGHTISVVRSIIGPML